MNYQITPKTLKQWLKENNISRMQLADMLMVSKNTIDGWCSGRPIGLRRKESLHLLMMENELIKKTAASSSKNESFKITSSFFTREQWKCICVAAKIKHMTPAAFLKISIFQSCKIIMREQQSE